MSLVQPLNPAASTRPEKWTAWTRLAGAIAFGIRPESQKAKEPARVALAFFDGAFVAAQSDAAPASNACRRICPPASLPSRQALDMAP
jgi:hypothetical protein